MTDLDQQLRRALGEPPSDPHARDRALVRLRSHMSEAETARSRTRSNRVRLGVVALVSFAILAAGVSIASLEHPAVATQLDGLAQKNLDWISTQDLHEIRIDQVHLAAFSGELYGGPSYTMIVHSTLSRTIKQGSVTQTEQIISAEFESEADRQTWRSVGSPDFIPHAGDVISDTFHRPVYDIKAMPTDPVALRQALQDGSVTGNPIDDELLFETIGSLLTEPGLTSEQRVGLYQVVGSIEGVQPLGETEDPLQRVGVGFSMMVGSQEQILIFDGDTGQPLATEAFSTVDPAKIEQWQAFTNTAP